MSDTRLNLTGLNYFFNRLKAFFAAKSEIPTKVSDLTNDSGFITQEADPTVPAWAKASSKPTYTAAEVGALSSSDVANNLTTTDAGKVLDARQGKALKDMIPAKVSDLTNDAGYQTASDVSSAISSAISGAYTFKGSVATYADLPANPSQGDVYDVRETGTNYAWTGTAWDALGQIVDTSTLWAKDELVAITTAQIDAIVDA